MAELYMELTPKMEKKLVDLFDIEIEVLQGTREKMADGRTAITCEVPDHKGKPIVKFCAMVIADTPNINLN